MLLYVVIIMSPVVILSLTDCCSKKPPVSSEPAVESKKESSGKRKSSEAPADARDAKHSNIADAKKKTGEKAPPTPGAPAGAPGAKAPQPVPSADAGGDDVGYESCPDMTPEELAKVVNAPK